MLELTDQQYGIEWIIAWAGDFDQQEDIAAKIDEESGRHGKETVRLILGSNNDE